MKLLIDTDAFCKLAAGGMFEDAVRLLGVEPSKCGRLTALPYMLRRGGLRKRYGAETCDSLKLIADGLPVIVPPGDVWMERLTPLDAIDPGEAQIFGAAAEHGLMVLSGDKRALCALKGVAEIHSALAGRIVVLDAVLIALCDRLGLEEVRSRVQPLTATDQIFKICFSKAVSDPRECLRSYFGFLAAEVAPLVLWKPPVGGRK